MHTTLPNLSKEDTAAFHSAEKWSFGVFFFFVTAATLKDSFNQMFVYDVWTGNVFKVRVSWWMQHISISNIINLVLELKGCT